MELNALDVGGYRSVMETNDLVLQQEVKKIKQKDVTTRQIVTVCLNYINNTLCKQENMILIPD